MCGIIAYKGQRNAFNVVIEGLKNLEYRGYDSFGFAIKENPGLKLIKKTGKIGDFVYNTPLESRICVGHTRWATHGAVTVSNAHPHTDCEEKLAVVHNGIIENYQELKNELISKGHVFKSETDTEVIPHLIEEYRKTMPFVEAAKKAILRLEGSYAIIVIDRESDVMIAARKNSPLILGVGNDEFFVASDVPAFMKYTKNVVYLHEYDFIVIENDFKIYNLESGQEVKREVKTIEWDIEQAKKGNFDHYMLKEIMEQNQTVLRAIEQEPERIKNLAKKINDAHGIFFVACGSSYHACLSASYIFSKLAKKHVNVVLASEFAHYEHFLTDKTLVIAVSQSGETADVLEAVRAAKNKGSKIMSVVNVMGSSLTRESDDVLMMHSGPEICVLSTKTYTSQLALLNLLAYACAGEYETGKKSLKDVRNFVETITSHDNREKIKELAKKLKDKEHIFTIGRSLQYPTALEAALKIKEVSYIHAEGFAGGELKHGTIALIEEGTPCIVFFDSETERETLSNATEIKARGGYIIGIGPKNNEIFDYFIEVPEMNSGNSIGQIIPAQLLAYELAVLRGCNPDKPRNLAKSVTVK
jgi:glucosamine--fructose-6-phosphate aminotransferase (isomerizing)